MYRRFRPDFHLVHERASDNLVYIRNIYTVIPCHRRVSVFPDFFPPRRDAKEPLIERLYARLIFAGRYKGRRGERKRRALESKVRMVKPRGNIPSHSPDKYDPRRERAHCSERKIYFHRTFWNDDLLRWISPRARYVGKIQITSGRLAVTNGVHPTVYTLETHRSLSSRVNSVDTYLWWLMVSEIHFARRPVRSNRVWSRLNVIAIKNQMYVNVND